MNILLQPITAILKSLFVFVVVCCLVKASFTHGAVVTTTPGGNLTTLEKVNNSVNILFATPKRESVISPDLCYDHRLLIDLEKAIVNRLDRSVQNVKATIVAFSPAIEFCNRKFCFDLFDLNSWTLNLRAKRLNPKTATQLRETSTTLNKGQPFKTIILEILHCRDFSLDRFEKLETLLNSLKIMPPVVWQEMENCKAVRQAALELAKAHRLFGKKRF